MSLERKKEGAGQEGKGRGGVSRLSQVGNMREGQGAGWRRGYPRGLRDA